MGGKVRTDPSPVITAVLALPDVLGTVIQHTRILWRKHDGSGNGPSEIRVADGADGAHTEIDTLRAPCPAIHLLQKAPGAVGEYDVRMGGIDRHEARFPAGQGKPIEVADLAERTSTGDGERDAILLAAVDPVGIPVIGGDLVDLGRLLVVPRAPGSTAVETDRRPLIPTVHDMAWIGRIDPPLVRVVAPGGSFEGNQGATPIGGSVDTGTHCVDDIRITRVDQEL